MHVTKKNKYLDGKTSMRLLLFKFLIICLSILFTGCANKQLNMAIINGNIVQASTLLNEENVNTEISIKYYNNTYIGTLLHRAINDNDFEMVKLLVSKGANVNAIAKEAIGKRNFTPLALAIDKQNKDIAMFLMDKNADINAKTSFRTSYIEPIIFTAINRDSDIAIELVKRGVNLNVVEAYSNKTPLHYAATKNTELIQLMLDKGLNLNAVDSVGITPLHSAVIFRNFNNVKLLVDKGANVNSLRYNGYSPLDEIQSDKDKDIICFLKTQGAQHAKNVYYSGSTRIGDIEIELYADEKQIESSLLRITNHSQASILFTDLSIEHMMKYQGDDVNNAVSSNNMNIFIQPKTRMIITNTQMYGKLIKEIFNKQCSYDPVVFNLTAKYTIQGFVTPITTKTSLKIQYEGSRKPI